MATKRKQLPIVEAVTGVIMVMIVLNFGLPRYLNWLQESKINIATSQMIDDLHVARNTAIQNRHKVIVTFNPASSGYTIHEDVNGNDAYDSGEPARKGVLERGIQYGTNSKLKATDVWGHGPVGENPIALIGGGNRITFSTQGQASKSGAIYLVPVEEVNIRNDRLRAIRIIRTTGNIEVFSHAVSASPPWQ